MTLDLPAIAAPVSGGDSTSSLLLDRSKRILLSAFGIHVGGGLVLLEALLTGLNGVLKTALLDERFVNAHDVLPLAATIESVPRSFIARLVSLNKLSRIAVEDDVLLCFNSLPPLRKSKARVVIYVHAPHFVGAHRGIRYARTVALRIVVERIWFRFGIKNCDEIWVQTHTMANAVKRLYPFATVQIVPLIDDELRSRLVPQRDKASGTKEENSRHAFFYPADGVGHKNHVNLLRAWKILGEQGKRPKLFLTLSDDEWRMAIQLANLERSVPINIENMGRLPRESVLAHLQRCSALIFPSMAETFGLPLLEARALGVPIIASERDFVRDVCFPTQTFDPDSPRSIAMAVDRYIGNDAFEFTSYYSAQEFIEKILS